MTNRHWIGASLALALLATSAHAVSPADKCEAAKLKIAGKYSFCRLKAEAKAVKTGDPVDYSKCDPSFSDKWATTEMAAGGMCPSNGDSSAMALRITNDANDVAACLSGSCPQPPPTPTVTPPSCGNGIVNGSESCDGSDFAGATCSTLGYTLGGVLGCTAGCGYDVSGCKSQAFPASGQLDSTFGPNSDGAIRAGAPLSFTVDYIDGTVTDHNTGLMWEMKDDAGGAHDKDGVVSWSITGVAMDGLIVNFLNGLNDVSGGGANCYAGYCDWRIPNVKELESIANYAYPGLLDPAFNDACLPGCQILGCSCTKTSIPETKLGYWSSTSADNLYSGPNGLAFQVVFTFDPDAHVVLRQKTGAGYVRAVRGGL